jgi:glycine cleavage system pyridoxal-binding protein P
MVAGMFAVYHGPKGLKYIADKVQWLQQANNALKQARCISN